MLYASIVCRNHHLYCSCLQTIRSKYLNRRRVALSTNPKAQLLSSQLCVYHFLFMSYILMPSVWNVITPDRSFSCHSCPGLVRCSDYQPPRPFWLAELNSLSHFNRRSAVIGTWQWKLLAGQLYVCLTDSSSVLDLCGWEWPMVPCAFCFRLAFFVRFHYLTELICIWVSKKYLKTFH